MADDWIKFRKKLVRDGRVLAVARKCNASETQVKRGVTLVVGALVTLWCIADEYAEPDGHLPGYTAADLDAEIGIQGFCAALPAEWLEVRGDAIYLPNYQAHNGMTAKRRAEANVRVTKHRIMKRECNVRALQKALPEKRREEKKGKKTTSSSLAPAGPATPAKEASAAEASADQGQKPDPKPRPRDELFDAVVGVTGSDPDVSGGHVAKVCKLLRAADPPYTPAEVRQFPAAMRARGLDFTVTVGALEKHIGWVRTPATPTGRPPPKGSRLEFQGIKEFLAGEMANGDAGGIRGGHGLPRVGGREGADP